MWGAGSSLALLALTRAFLRRERRAPGEVGLGISAGSFPRLGAGLLLGAAVYALTLLAISLTVGPLEVTRVAGSAIASVLPTLATTFALVVMEELAFRGYALRTAERAVGVWPAQGLVAVAFALMHVAYGWPWQTVVLGVLPGGVLFGVAAVASRGLALPIGIHAGLNLARWLAGESGPGGMWQVGVAAGQEGSVGMWAPWIGVAATLAAAGAVWWWYGWRGARGSS